MSFFEDDRPKKPAAVHPGEILDTLSIEELRARIGTYEAEIERLKREIEAKEKHLKAAASVFKR